MKNSITSSVLFSLLLSGCLNEYDEEYAREFALSGDFVTAASEMPEDAGENSELALDMLREAGWRIRYKADGGQPKSNDLASSVDLSGPLDVWLASDWATKSNEDRAREGWHEYVHTGEIAELGVKKIARLRDRDVYWHVAIEIPAERQSIVVYGLHGMPEYELYEFADHLVNTFSDWGADDDWISLAQDVFWTQIDEVMDRRTP